MNLYDYIIIRDDFIPDNINAILSNFTQTEKIPADIKSVTEQKPNLEYRKTNIHTLPSNIIQNLNYSMIQIHDTIVKPKYNTLLAKLETPQLLSYDINGHYDEHNDCEDYVNNILTRVIDRDITLIFYLNDNYTGGELEFTKLGLTYKPKKNSMIIFPSYYEFSHRVHPIRSGIRTNLVCWLATKDRIYVR